MYLKLTYSVFSCFLQDVCLRRDAQTLTCPLPAVFKPEPRPSVLSLPETCCRANITGQGHTVSPGVGQVWGNCHHNMWGTHAQIPQSQTGISQHPTPQDFSHQVLWSFSQSRFKYFGKDYFYHIFVRSLSGLCLNCNCPRRLC